MALVSVIIPTFNRLKVLDRAIKSVLSQTYSDFELVIVDDGSTDSTGELLQKYIDHPKIRTFRTENQGVSAARNLGLQMAQGKWIGFLDSDDEWLSDKLEKQMSYLEAHPETKVVHGEEIWIRKGVRVNPMKKHQKKGGDLFSDATRFCCMSPSTIMIRKDFIEERGSFDEAFPVCEDYDLWLRLSFDQEIGFLPNFLIKKYGGHEDQLSAKFHSMDYWRIKALRKILDFPISLSQKEMVLLEISKKRKVLLKGYRKHQNLEDFDEIFFSLNEKKPHFPLPH